MINGNGENDPYADLKQHRLPPEMVADLLKRAEVGASTFKPHKIKTKRQKFIQVPWTWFECLQDAPGRTIVVALTLLWLHWRHNGEPIKLGNGATGIVGVNRYSKYRALAHLERRGLITVERRPRKSPRIRLNL
jgi:hypothetical protein